MPISEISPSALSSSPLLVPLATPFQAEHMLHPLLTVAQIHLLVVFFYLLKLHVNKASSVRITQPLQLQTSTLISFSISSLSSDQLHLPPFLIL